jgi:hypothetical protein
VASFGAMAAPGGTGPIGPFPPRVEGEEAQDDNDKLRRRVLWSLPYGLYVVGSRAGRSSGAGRVWSGLG